MALQTVFFHLQAKQLLFQAPQFGYVCWKLQMDGILSELHFCAWLIDLAQYFWDEAMTQERSVFYHWVPFLIW